MDILGWGGAAVCVCVWGSLLALLTISAELMKSKFIGRPSAACSSAGRLRHQLSLLLLHGFLSSFSCCFPWVICPNLFSLTWNPGSKNFKMVLLLTKPQPKVYKLFLNFLLSGSHRITFGIFSSSTCSSSHHGTEWVCSGVRYLSSVRP